MISEKLEAIVKDGIKANLPAETIKIQLKEFLILCCLDFIYNSPKWNKLVFTGGTALRILGKTGRLSEDLDLDILTENFNAQTFFKEASEFLKKSVVPDALTVLKSRERIIILKFPILEKLGLKKEKMETDFLQVKLEIEENRYQNYGLTLTPIMKENFFFVARSYDFPTLFANKIGAILGRKGKIFHNRYDFRGRDFYDLIWFLENGYLPNLERTKEILKAEQNLEIQNYGDIWQLLEKRIESIDTAGIYDDLKNLALNPEAARNLSQNYRSIFETLVIKKI